MKVHLGNLAGIYNETGLNTQQAVQSIVSGLNDLQEKFDRATTRSQSLLKHSALQELDYASSGHTGFASAASIPISSNPTASVGLTAVNGSAATFMRSDAAPPLDSSIYGVAGSMAAVDIGVNVAGTGTTLARIDHKHDLSEAIAPVWTGYHQFAAAAGSPAKSAGFNAGIDIALSGADSGIIQSSAPDTALSVGFDLIQSIQMTTFGAQLFRLTDYAAHSAISVYYDGQIILGGLSGAHPNNVLTLGADGTWVTGDYEVWAANIRTSPTGVAIPPNAKTGIAAYYGTVGWTTNASTAIQYVGGVFSVRATRISTNPAGLWGAWFCPMETLPTSSAAKVVPEAGGWRSQAILSSGSSTAGTITNYYGGYVENARGASAYPVITNDYGLYVEEQTKGGTLNYGIFLANATAAYKAIAIRDSSTWIGSSAAATLDLNATTIKMVGNVDVSTKNIVTDTSTGTKIATGTTQKLGFFNASPIIQPANTVAINDVLVNLGLRASGGVSNFTTNLDISTKNIVTDTSTGTQIGTGATQKLSLWGVGPVVQPAGALQAAITNSTGGSQDGTLVDVTTATLADPAKCNNNFTDLYALVDAMRTALVAAGIMKGAA